MFNLELLIWFGVNIFVPVVLPFLILLIPLGIKKTRPYGKGLILKAVQDGQLFWLAIALCAVGSYELYAYQQVESDRTYRIAAGFTILGLVIIWGISLLLAVLHSLDIPQQAEKTKSIGDTTKVPAKNAPGSASMATETDAALGRPALPEPDMGMVKTSVTFVVLVAIAASVSHHLSASATQSAILKHEQAWLDYATCLKARGTQRHCQQPEGAQ